MIGIKNLSISLAQINTATGEVSQISEKVKVNSEELNSGVENINNVAVELDFVLRGIRKSS